MNQNKYDYIILGAGAAGLSLVYRMIKDDFFLDKKILLLDRYKKDQNDRTWCYWETDEGIFEDVVFKSWEKLKFFTPDKCINLDTGNYSYKMIRGQDFYNHTISAIEKCPNIVFRIDEVVEITLEDGPKIKCKSETYSCDQIFKSFPSAKIDKNKFLYVNQHFKGWFIKTEDEYFDDQSATFMDFRLRQEDGDQFMYVLPTSKRSALVEVAIFSNKILFPDAYNEIIKEYIEETLGITSYQLQEEEFGIIPMTSYPFWKDNKEGLFHIGTAGGAVKPSSGYAFQRIQRHSTAIIQCLKSGAPLTKANKDIKSKYFLYDNTMLNAMLKKGVRGKDLFSALFEKTDAHRILKFLDGDTSLMEEISIFKAPPMFPFFRAFFEEMRRK